MKPCFVISHSDEFRVSTWLYLWPGETTILRFGARKFVRVIDHSPRILIPPVFLFFELRRVSRQSWKFSRMLGGICTKGSDYVRAVCRYGHPLEDTPLSKLLWDCNEAMTAAWYRITSLSLTWEKYSHIRVYQRGPSSTDRSITVLLGSDNTVGIRCSIVPESKYVISATGMPSLYSVEFTGTPWT